MQIGQDNNRHMVDVLFVITLFGVFAISALTLIILGANIYRNTCNHMDSNYATRTTSAYILQKVHQEDFSGAITLGKIGDSDALIMTKEINNTMYNTYLYEYNGQLYELMSRADQEITPAFGTAILPIDSLKILAVRDNLYQIDVKTEDGEQISFHVSNRSESEVIQ